MYHDVPGTAWLWRKVTEHVEANGTDEGRLVSLGYQAYRRRFVRAAKLPGCPQASCRSSYATSTRARSCLLAFR